MQMTRVLAGQNSCCVKSYTNTNIMTARFSCTILDTWAKWASFDKWRNMNLGNGIIRV